MISSFYESQKYPKPCCKTSLIQLDIVQLVSFLQLRSFQNNYTYF